MSVSRSSGGIAGRSADIRCQAGTFRIIAGDIVQSRPLSLNRRGRCHSRPEKRLTHGLIVTGFSLSDHQLFCDDAALGAIAEEVGTPAYVYSASVIRQRYEELDRAFRGHPHAIHYAL